MRSRMGISVARSVERFRLLSLVHRPAFASLSCFISCQFTLQSRSSHPSSFLYVPTSCELKASTKRARDKATATTTTKKIKDDF